MNAHANMAQGKGTENPRHYGDQCQLHFLDIDNIHTMRNSLRYLLDNACGNPDVLQGFNGPSNALEDFLDAQPADVWASIVHASGWLSHVRQVMQGAYAIAQCVDAGESAVVHCSDGWDRTSQLTALAQIMLNERYRTFDGFMVSLEHDLESKGVERERKVKHGVQRQSNTGWTCVYAR